LAALDPAKRRGAATTLRSVADNLAEVFDATMASHVLGVVAHLLDSS